VPDGHKRCHGGRSKDDDVVEGHQVSYADWASCPVSKIRGRKFTVEVHSKVKLSS